MTKRKPNAALPKVSDQVRTLVQDCGLSLNELSRRTGIDTSALSRFINGERGVSSAALDRLGVVLGLRVTMGDKPRQNES